MPPFDGSEASAGLLARLEHEVSTRAEALPGVRRRGFVSSDLTTVHHVLGAVRDQGLARGDVLCDWGSGLGAVCAVAASLGYEAHGIEIQESLVQASRELLAELGLPARIAHGSFLQPGDDDLLAGCSHTAQPTDADPWVALGLQPATCDVVFAYPWPGEEQMHDQVFGRHASPGALLLTFHEGPRVLVQRRLDDPDELQTVGWFEGGGQQA